MTSTEGNRTSRCISTLAGILAWCSPLLLSSGCATGSVRMIGHRCVRTLPTEILVAPDGSVAVRVDAYYSRNLPAVQDTLLSTPSQMFLHAFGLLGSGKRIREPCGYLVASRKVIEEAIQGASRYRTHNNSDVFHWLLRFKMATRKEPGWVLMKAKHKALASDVLPKSFRSDVVSYSYHKGRSPDFPYKANGQDYLLYLGGAPTIWQRAWWSYPLLAVLVPPSFAFDVATSPLQWPPVFLFLGAASGFR